MDSAVANQCLRSGRSKLSEVTHGYRTRALFPVFLFHTGSFCFPLAVFCFPSGLPDACPWIHLTLLLLPRLVLTWLLCWIGPRHDVVPCESSLLLVPTFAHHRLCTFALCLTLRTSGFYSVPTLSWQQLILGLNLTELPVFHSDSR